MLTANAKAFKFYIPEVPVPTRRYRSFLKIFLNSVEFNVDTVPVHKYKPTCTLMQCEILFCSCCNQYFSFEHRSHKNLLNNHFDLPLF